MNISLKELLAQQASSPTTKDSGSSTSSPTTTASGSKIEEVIADDHDEDYERICHLMMGRTVVRVAFGSHADDSEDKVAIIGFDDGSSAVVHYGLFGISAAPFAPEALHTTPFQAQ